jgi:AcrR family transcriptional regulator
LACDLGKHALPDRDEPHDPHGRNRTGRGTLRGAAVGNSALGVHPGCTMGTPPSVRRPRMATIRMKTASQLFGLPEQPRSGRGRLVAAAVELLCRREFGAIGIDHVIATAGVTKTTFYKHFESRDDLMVAAVEQRDEWESHAWARALRRLAGDDDPVRHLLAMFDLFDFLFNDPDYHGCMFNNAAAEFPNPHDPVHQAAAAHKRRTRDQWRDLARAGGADATAAETFADCFTALIEGALVLRQTFGRNDAARVVRPAVEQLIRAYVPGVVCTGAPVAHLSPRGAAGQQGLPGSPMARSARHVQFPLTRGARGGGSRATRRPRDGTTAAHRPIKPS